MYPNPQQQMYMQGGNMMAGNYGMYNNGMGMAMVPGTMMGPMANGVFQNRFCFFGSAISLQTQL